MKYGKGVYSVIEGMVWEEKTRCKACYLLDHEVLFSQQTQNKAVKSCQGM